MDAGNEAARPDDGSTDEDVLRLLRTGTAAEHEDVERTLALLDPDLDRDRLAHVLDLMHGFWRAAEAGLDRWAGEHPADAEPLTWPRRRRTALFAGDLAALGAAPSAGSPELPPVGGTDEALGRMYVLEGSTLGGVFIDRHLAGLPGLADVTIRAFSPYGSETGAMWAAFRRATRARVAGGGDATAVLAAARSTFADLAGWCRPAARPGVPA
ncbi:biliverdin-producing heme oxygenase [Blastococcus sp. TML/M2B]|uniref:biliverdin-producing heme oxygenase n=1 Tax=unclassified Blastococcus TaxID=2619396 RepID=UPI00190D5672|nr:MULTISPECIES: biliverdin-producing heme oxygenase [unclassified Blastococcus]MBN1091945.1 biliverdin-producing heme oxygenase [Blastococcus sp. TML/M2B]MBN1097954.1 biliverdin-producing heme oxygenase [Blastococcus sp. TML/C7B]